MKSYHPITCLIYYALVIGITIFSASPVFLFLSFLGGTIYACYLRTIEDGIDGGLKTLKNIMSLFVFVLIISSIMNGLFTHNGATVLFYIGPNRITKEAFCYGAVMSLMISSVIVWFISFGDIMTSDKLVNIFGKLTPVLGLTISMIFRFIPLLRKRYTEIRMGQLSLGRSNEEIRGPINKLRQKVKEISILISWSLEASIESADSMAARGYGLPGRTSYRIFKFEKRDYLLSVSMILIGIASIVFILRGAFQIYYYPEIRFAKTQTAFNMLASIISFSVLVLIPTAVDMTGEYRWKRSA